MTEIDPQQFGRLEAEVPALSLYNESETFGHTDLNFHPKRHVLPNPIGQIQGAVTFGSGGNENGRLTGYAAQGGSLIATKYDLDIEQEKAAKPLRN